MARIAVVEKSKCNPVSCAELCIKLCPINREDKDCIVRTDKIAINEDLCTGCGICQNRCPFHAISIINLPEQLKEEPIHRFGKNGFCLYRLPIPKKGKVVGILGRNGIGKSTAIKVLSGLLVPNMNKGNESYDEIIKHFRGSELQEYFTEMRDGKIKVSYKPQKVEEISAEFKGKVVKELLEHVDEKGKLHEYGEELGIENIFERKVEELSGGELQKIAVLATSLRDANFYYFDEPSSYLDISQRLKVARFIKKLSEENSVVVIEHDLIVLDYLADVIHVMYGKPSGYGVVSQPLSDKNGINVYLEGFLRGENVRFRDKKIDFEVKSGLKEEVGGEYCAWPHFTKKLNGFGLVSEGGSINENEAVGILGQNGIGKTTFVKVLAGVLESDSGKVDLKMKVSYKPQYVEGNDLIVKDVLKSAFEHYKNQIVVPLEIEDFMEKKVSELSGGELQRVAIANCLSQEADLYLLDEPSAYLDVEQRLIVARVINEIMAQKGKSAFVVDHDLLFVDYLARRLLVFKGEPAVSGIVGEPMMMEEGMNQLLKELEITVRRDEENKRPRINKEGSVKDREQKKEGKYYYD